MADRHTLAVLARRRRGKWLLAGAAGAVLGLGLKAAFGTQPVGSFLDRFQLVGELMPQARLWLDAHPAVTGWIAGPVVLGLLFLAIAALPAVRAALDRLLPDPPPFVRSALDEARWRDRVISLEGPPLPFVGRGDSMAEIDALLRADGGPFGWRVLTGPSGIGKTRLAIEWLERARAKGWDAGLVDRDDFALVKIWKARRPTALVVDEARRDWDDRLGELLTALARAGTRLRPVRALVVDQVQPFVEVRSGEDRAMVKAAEAGPPLRLRGLEDVEIIDLCAASAAARVDEGRVVRESGGRPRAALILINAPDAASYAGALMEWVDRFLPGIADEARPLPLALAGPLFLAALAGPIDTDTSRELFGPVDAPGLARFYGDERPEDLEQRLPALAPDDLAQLLLVRLFPRLDRKLREAAVNRTIADLPDRVEARLGGLWRDRSGLAGGGALLVLTWLQQRFDAAQPDRLAEARERAAAIAARMAEWGATLPLDDGAVAAAAELADARPYDVEIRRAEATVAVNAMHHYGRQGNWTELERWGSRLAAICADETFAADPWFRIYKANGAALAVQAYGEAQQFDAMERWAERLIGLGLDERYAKDADLRLEEAHAANSAVQYLGAAGDLAGVERWAARLIALAEDERFAGRVDFAFEAAEAAVAATVAYGEAGDIAGMAGWAQCLAGIADDERFSGSEEIRRLEAIGAANIIGYCCRTGEIGAAELWEARLIGLAEDPRFASNAEIRCNEARAAVNLIPYCVVPNHAERLERWGDRLSALIADDRFAPDREIRLRAAKAAVNAIYRYGEASDFSGLERWGRRLKQWAADGVFANDSDMRVLEAEGAVNAMIAYRAAARFEDIERWGDALIALSRDRRFSHIVEMRILECEAAVNATGHYADAGDLESVERWGKRLVDVADDRRFAASIEIKRLDAAATSNALLAYRRAGRLNWPHAVNWRSRLARVARECVSDAKVQALAAEYGLTAANQRHARR